MVLRERILFLKPVPQLLPLLLLQQHRLRRNHFVQQSRPTTNWQRNCEPGFPMLRGITSTQSSQAYEGTCLTSCSRKTPMRILQATWTMLILRLLTALEIVITERPATFTSFMQ